MAPTPSAEFLAAAENHYRELYPNLQRRDNILFFPKQGVVLVFETDKAALLTGVTHPDLREIIDRILPPVPQTNLDKINQTRAWKYLYSKVPVRCFEYADPKLFALTDEALSGES